MRQRYVAVIFGSVAAAFSLAAARADDTNQTAPPTMPASPLGRTHDCLSYYPFEAARLNESGTVFLTYDIGADGVIRNVVIKAKSGFDDLDAAALACVTRKWRATPATRDGIAVESPGHQAMVEFNVGLQSSDAFYRRGVSANGAQMWPLALSTLTRAIEMKPDFKDAYYQRGLTYDNMYDREHALADYAKAGVPPPPPVVPPPTGPSIAIGTTHDCTDHFPLLSAQLFENGEVQLQYDVGADGVIANVVALKSSGSERLDQAALSCVRERWRNIPARLNGVGIASPGHKANVLFNGGGPRFAGQFYVRGHALGSLGEYARAVTDFDEAILLDPNLALAYLARANAYDALGQHDRADADRLKLKSLGVDAGQAPQH